MSTPLVVSVTDELVAELEAMYLAGWEASGEGWNAEYPGDAHETKGFTDLMHKSCAPIIAKLIAERAELLRDRERLNKLDQAGYAYGFEDMHEGNCWDISGPFKSVRDAIDSMQAIDAAMQSEAKP